MKNLRTIYKDNITTHDFSKFYKSNKLGNLYFPNGTRPTTDTSVIGHNKVPYFISLEELYTAIELWHVKSDSVKSFGLFGIIAIGDTVKYPGYEVANVPEYKGATRKMVIKKIPIQPIEAEFLIITENNPLYDDCMSLNGELSEAYIDTRHNDLHLHLRSIEQMIKGARTGTVRTDMENVSNERTITKDAVSIDALTNGIPIFYDDLLEYITYNVCGIENKNEYKLQWYMDNNKLFGKIGHDKNG